MASSTTSAAPPATSSRERVLTALRHQEPDRVPVDFLATPEIWQRLAEHFKLDGSSIDSGGFFTPEREMLLRQFSVDCRLVSYDMFCAPPERVLHPQAQIDWWSSLSRSSPNRMWRQLLPDGSSLDIWGHHTRTVENPSGAYEEFLRWPLREAATTLELSQYDWPEPDWWDFSPLRSAIQRINPNSQYHLRYRAGTVFESAWQLRGMEEFLTDLAINPDIPLYIMERLTDVIVENTRRVLQAAGDLIDMVYFYDDVGAQTGLMISKNMWRRFIRPFHQRIIETARSFGKSVMYHCDGAIYPLIGELIDMGVDVLNPIQPNAKDMAPARLKAEFGDRLAFHGGIDIVGTLPKGTPEEVRDEVRQRVRGMGEGGGYILASSHHIQADTPIQNILAMYALELRRRDA
jgi:uroporphyrinogen decarboxylase